MQGLTPHGFPGWVAGASLTLRNYTFFLLHSESRRTTEKVMGSCNAGTFPCHVWRCTFNLPRVGIHSQGLRCVAHLPQGLSSQQNCLCLNCLKKQFYWPVSSWFLSSLFFWLFLSSYFYCSRMSTRHHCQTSQSLRRLQADSRGAPSPQSRCASAWPGTRAPNRAQVVTWVLFNREETPRIIKCLSSLDLFYLLVFSSEKHHHRDFYHNCQDSQVLNKTCAFPLNGKYMSEMEKWRWKTELEAIFKLSPFSL